jgi:hypothetical protein
MELHPILGHPTHPPGPNSAVCRSQGVHKILSLSALSSILNIVIINPHNLLASCIYYIAVYTPMAPSATTTIVTPSSKTQVSVAPETHVHGAEDKTPLEAISHGPLIQPGMYEILVSLLRMRLMGGPKIISSRQSRRREASQILSCVYVRISFQAHRSTTCEGFASVFLYTISTLL